MMKICDDCDHGELCMYKDEVDNFIDAVNEINVPTIIGNPLKVNICCPSHKLLEPTIRIK